MLYRLQILALMMVPLFLFLAGCWLIIWAAKRYYPDCKERQVSISIIHGGIVLGVFGLMGQIMYHLHDLDM